MVSFKHWVAQSDHSHRQIALRLGCSPSYISLLLAGSRTPSLEMIRRMLLISNGSLKAEDLILEFTTGI